MLESWVDQWTLVYGDILKSWHLFLVYFLVLLINIIIIHTRRRVTSSVLGTDHSGIDIFLPKFLWPHSGPPGARSGAPVHSTAWTPGFYDSVPVTFEAIRPLQNRFKLYLVGLPLWDELTRLCMGWQWRNFVQYLCQLLFAAILWVNSYKCLLLVCHVNTLCL